MTKFIKSEKRSKQLLEWIIEENEAIQEINRVRREALANEENWDEAELKEFLFINSESYKTAKEFIQWCIENIVSWHLTPKELQQYNKLRDSKTDTTVNYMM